MKRIAIFCHDRAVSGANFSLLDYLESYDRNKYQILVVLPHRGTELCSKLETLNVNFAVLNLFSVTKSIGKVNIKIRLKKILQRIINSLKYSFKIKNMEKILRDFNPELIISNSFATLYGALFAQKLNVKHVFHIREYMELDHQTTHYNPKTVEQYCRNSYAVYISNSIKDYYESKYTEYLQIFTGFLGSNYYEYYKSDASSKDAQMKKLVQQVKDAWNNFILELDKGYTREIKAGMYQ